MSKEMQIKKMANCINAMDEPNAHYYGKHMEMHEAFADCFTIAKHLYNAGYRKQIEGEWIDEFKGEFVNPIYVCSLCGKGTLLKPHINELGNMEMVSALSSYCPNCGAKMKGGTE